MPILFLHGLESSSKGTKGRFLKGLFPDIIAPDFTGSLDLRLQKLHTICAALDELVLIGSSFGGLMATCFAIQFPEKTEKLILFAPALNFPEFTPPEEPIEIPAEIFIGNQDDVTPASTVIPRALQTFVHPLIHEVEDNHLLHKVYAGLNWQKLVDI